MTLISQIRDRRNNRLSVSSEKSVRICDSDWLLFDIDGNCVRHQANTDARRANETLCAEVKIEIQQELTLERQAFEAHMRINNGLEHITLENVGVTVNFTDEEGNPVEASSNPDSTTATFFIRVDEMQNIGAVDGTGTVQPSSNADIYWLIIPAPGASDGNPQGKLYYVGATLKYTI